MNNFPSVKAQISEYLQVLKTSWDMQLRQEAFQAAAVLAQDSIEVFDELVQQETDTELLAYVAEIIVESDRDEGAIRILPLLQYPASHLRRHTCGLLSNCRDPRTVDSLLERLTTDDSADVRVIAAFALGKIGDPKALSVLIYACKHDFATDYEKSSVSDEAKIAIERIAGRSR